MIRGAPGEERTARLWEAGLVASLLAIAALAWVWTHRLAASHMGMGSGSGDAMSPMSPVHPAGPVGLYLLSWIVMMVAMMLPSMVPVVLVFDRWSRKSSRPRSQTALFVGSYFVVWGAIGLVIYGAAGVAQPLLPSGDGMVRWLGGLLLLAGIYQLSPLKLACLRQCRSPLAFVAQHSEQLTRGGIAAAKVGARHGLICVGCCWGLMLVLAMLAMTSLVWIAAVAAVIFLEKVAPGGQRISALTGVLLLSVGLALLVSPQIWAMGAAVTVPG